MWKFRPRAGSFDGLHLGEFSWGTWMARSRGSIRFGWSVRVGCSSPLPITKLYPPRAGFEDSYLVDSASSHMLVSKIKPCMSKYKQLYGETANGSLNQLSFI